MGQRGLSFLTAVTARADDAIAQRDDASDGHLSRRIGLLCQPQRLAHHFFVIHAVPSVSLPDIAGRRERVAAHFDPFLTVILPEE